MSQRRVVCVIPARLASQRLPGKPLLQVGGRALVARTWSRARRAQGLDMCVVACDDERVARAVRAEGGAALLTEPQLRSGTDRCAAAALELGLRDEDIVINVQGDEPFVAPRHVELLAHHARERLPAHAMATIAVREPRASPLLHDPSAVKVVTDARGEALYFSRAAIPHVRADLAAQAPQSWLRHVGMYAFSVGFLRAFTKLDSGPLELAEGLEQLRALEWGHKVHVVEVPGPVLGGVDTPEQLRLADQLARSSAELD
jgi:3-deoxy-manno-octulosonate cytidylyltransferase (CMP-KDO synthetase)